MEFDLDDAGNIIAFPVLGWSMAPVAGMTVLLRLQFARDQDGLRTGGEALQFVLTPGKAQELGEALTRQAQRLLNASQPPGRPS